MIILKFESTRDFVNWLVDEDTMRLQQMMRDYEIKNLESWFE